MNPITTVASSKENQSAPIQPLPIKYLLPETTKKTVPSVRISLLLVTFQEKGEELTSNRDVYF
jgi:hypothetical protein